MIHEVAWSVSLLQLNPCQAICIYIKHKKKANGWRTVLSSRDNRCWRRFTKQRWATKSGSVRTNRITDPGEVSAPIANPCGPSLISPASKFKCHIQYHKIESCSVTKQLSSSWIPAIKSTEILSIFNIPTKILKIFIKNVITSGLLFR